MLLYDQAWVPSAGLALGGRGEKGLLFEGILICSLVFPPRVVLSGTYDRCEKGRGGGIRLRGLRCFWDSFSVLGLIEGTTGSEFGSDFDSGSGSGFEGGWITHSGTQTDGQGFGCDDMPRKGSS